LAVSFSLSARVGKIKVNTFIYSVLCDPGTVVIIPCHALPARCSVDGFEALRSNIPRWEIHRKTVAIVVTGHSETIDAAASLRHI
jgi:hypothetical protein